MYVDLRYMVEPCMMTSTTGCHEGYQINCTNLPLPVILCIILLYITLLCLDRNLDLESCTWEITGYFHMSELVSKCGAQIRSDGQVGVFRVTKYRVNVVVFECAKKYPIYY